MPHAGAPWASNLWFHHWDQSAGESAVSPVSFEFQIILNASESCLFLQILLSVSKKA